MAKETELTLPSAQDPEAAIRRLVHHEWSSEFVPGKVRRLNDYEREVRIDAHRVDLIVDASKGKRTFRCSVLPDVGRFVIKSAPKRWVIRGPTREEMFSAIDRHQASRLRKSEITLLNVAHSHLVQIPVVQMAMHPLRTMLSYLDLRGSLPISAVWRMSKDRVQLKNYVSVLTRLGLARAEGEALVPGANFIREAAGLDAKTVYDQMLAIVLEREYPFLEQVLRLTQLVGYLRWSNTYYLTAFTAGDRINMLIDALESRHDSYYPAHRMSELERIGQIQRVIDCGLIVRSGAGVEGEEQVTERYFERASRDGIALAS
jgi:hypothetical protein